LKSEVLDCKSGGKYLANETADDRPLLGHKLPRNAGSILVSELIVNYFLNDDDEVEALRSFSNLFSFINLNLNLQSSIFNLQSSIFNLQSQLHEKY